MDNLQNPASPPPNPNELRAQFESLRQLVVSLLVLLLVVSGTLNLYFWRQFRATKGAVEAQRPQIKQLAAEFNQSQGPFITNFVAKLVEFEKKNPDLAPILARYGIRATGAPPATVASPLPAKK
jgi:hypothetical protein